MVLVTLVPQKHVLVVGLMAPLVLCQETAAVVNVTLALQISVLIVSLMVPLVLYQRTVAVVTVTLMTPANVFLVWMMELVVIQTDQQPVAADSVLMMEWIHQRVDAGKMEKHVVWMQTAVNLIKVVVLFVENKSRQILIFAVKALVQPALTTVNVAPLFVKVVKSVYDGSIEVKRIHSANNCNSMQQNLFPKSTLKPMALSAKCERQNRTSRRSITAL